MSSDVHERAVDRLAELVWDDAADGIVASELADRPIRWSQLDAGAKECRRQRAAAWLRDLGLVAVDPKLVEAVRAAKDRPCACSPRVDRPFPCARCGWVEETRAELADSILAALEEK